MPDRQLCLVHLPQMGRASLKSLGTKDIVVQTHSETVLIINEEENSHTLFVLDWSFILVHGLRTGLLSDVREK